MTKAILQPKEWIPRGPFSLGTQVGNRASAVEMPQLNGNLMMSPNIDPQKQSEIRGHKYIGDP